MICKTCGYEANENFSVCPYCGDKQSNSIQNQSSSKSVEQEKKNYNPDIEKFFKACGPFENNQNELKMSCSLSDGDFAKWSIVVIVSEVFLLFTLLNIFGKIYPENSSIFILSFFLLLIFSVCFINSAKLIINSSGINIKTVFKKYFIPKEKIDSLTCKIVKRITGKSASFYDIFIIMKDKSIFNKTEIDTGLCYMDKIHTDYLIDKFNEHLGLL